MNDTFPLFKAATKEYWAIVPKIVIINKIKICSMDGHFQTPSDKTNVAGIIPIADQSVIVKFESDLVKIFAMRTEDDQKKQAQRITIGPIPTDMSGLIIIIAPINPIDMAAHLLIPTISPRKKIASNVEKTGTVKPKACVFANSVILSP